MNNSLFVNERKSFGDLLRPLVYFFNDSRIRVFCWSCFWVIEDLTLQVSFALFHYQDHSSGVRFLEKGCAIKLYNMGMLQFSDEQNKKSFSYVSFCLTLCSLLICLPTRDGRSTLNLIKWRLTTASTRSKFCCTLRTPLDSVSLIAVITVRHGACKTLQFRL